MLPRGREGICGYGLVAECDLPKVETRVRFPVPAQKHRRRSESSGAGSFCCRNCESKDEAWSGYFARFLAAVGRERRLLAGRFISSFIVAKFFLSSFAARRTSAAFTDRAF